MTSISANTGYTTGGQTLIINGYGFNNPNISVTIDGAQCAVQNYSLNQFTCATGANANPSNATFYVG